MVAGSPPKVSAGRPSARSRCHRSRLISTPASESAMETSTSLAVDGDLRNVTGSDSVVLPEGTTVTYGLALSEVGIRQLTGAWLRSFKRLVRRRVARALHG